MCGGGPKVDTSVQDFQIEEAERARRDEEARQRRVDYGMEQIRAIFEGGRAPAAREAAGAYDPSQTYYTPEGNVWTPNPQEERTRTVRERVPTPRSAPAAAAPAGTAAPKGVPPGVAELLAMPIDERRAELASRTPVMVGGRPGPSRYYDSSGDIRYDSGVYSRSPEALAASLPHRDAGGDFRYGRDPNTVSSGQTTNQSQPRFTTRSETFLAGPTAEQQFGRAGELLVEGRGKRHAGVDPLLAKRRRAQEDFYLPQLDEQREDAEEQLVYALADAGLLKSTVADERETDLRSGFRRERAGVMSDIARDIASTSSNIQSQRAALESQLRASGDATATTDAALRARQTFRQDQPELSPLANTLAGFAEGIGGFRRGLDVGRVQRGARGTRGTVNRELGKVLT